MPYFWFQFCKLNIFAFKTKNQMGSCKLEKHNYELHYDSRLSISSAGGLNLQSDALLFVFQVDSVTYICFLKISNWIKPAN